MDGTDDWSKTSRNPRRDMLYVLTQATQPLESAARTFDQRSEWSAMLQSGRNEVRIGKILHLVVLRGGGPQTRRALERIELLDLTSRCI